MSEQQVLNAESETVKNSEGELNSAQSSQAQSVDYKSEWEKLKQERDNYAKGLISAKREIKRLKSDYQEEEESGQEALDIQHLVAKAVEQKLATIEFEKSKSAEDNFVHNLIKKNQELEIALTNRSQISSIPQSSGIEGPTSQTNLYSKEFEDEKRKAGWNDKDFERFKTNLMKANGQM
jgi:hypothetical protein